MADLFPYLATLLYRIADFEWWLVLGTGLLIGAYVFGWKGKRRWLLVLSVISASLCLYSGGYIYWFTHRPQPENLTRPLYPGVTYIRESRRAPRPLVIHVVRIDLNTPGLRFLITPPDTNNEFTLKARTTSEFLSDFNVQIAINAGFFQPWWSNSIFDYYPHPHDPVAPRGLTASEGVIYAPTDEGIHFTLYLSADNHPQFTPPKTVYNALSGNLLFLNHGQPTVIDHPYNNDLHPRTAIGFNQNYQKMILLLVDGRQPNYSEGVNMDELAAIGADHGMAYALNLDGGGSSTLVIEGENNQPEILNSPIDHGLPGQERIIANHLGIFIDTAPEGES